MIKIRSLETNFVGARCKADKITMQAVHWLPKQFRKAFLETLIVQSRKLFFYLITFQDYQILASQNGVFSTTIFGIESTLNGRKW